MRDPAVVLYLCQDLPPYHLFAVATIAAMIRSKLLHRVWERCDCKQSQCAHFHAWKKSELEEVLLDDYAIDQGGLEAAREAAEAERCMGAK